MENFKLIKFLISTLILLIFNFNLYSQSSEHEDCNGAIPVCQPVYVEPTPYLYSGEGNVPNEIYQTNFTSCFTEENNGVWYVFSAQNNGLLKFTIFPTNIDDDFDWTVVDITDISCADIFYRTDKYVSSNTWGDYDFNGNTGANSDSLSSGNCNGPGTYNGPRFNQDIPIDKNDTYVLYISNFTQSNDGYTIDFSASTATIFDNQPPVASFATNFNPKCNTTKIEISFNEYVKCSTITPSIFTFSNGINIIGVVSSQCDAGGDADNKFTLILDKPLFPGEYTLTMNSNITDNCGNLAPTQTFSFSLNQPAILDTNLVLDCETGNSSLTIIPNGNISNYIYTQQTSANSTNFSSNIINNLLPGSYSFFITNHITNCKSDSVNVLVKPYLPIIANANTTDNLCYGDGNGSININASGGSGNLLYSINGDFIENNNFSNLNGGFYSVQVKDSVCMRNLGNFKIFQPDKISINQDVTQIDCNGNSNGIIDLSVRGGTLPYAIDWSNGETSQSLTNLDVGTYTAYIRDENNCKDSVTITITQPEPLTTNFVTENITCNGGFNGKIDLTVNGGTQPYNYEWNNGCNNEDRENLYAGNYEVIVKDFNSCENLLSFELTQPTDFKIEYTQKDVSCWGLKDGSIALNIIGGTNQYQYLWTTGDTIANLQNIAAGYYMITINDQSVSKCAIAEINIKQPDSLYLDFKAINIKCNKGEDGKIDGTIKGGTPDYKFVITDDLGNNFYDFTGLHKGNYSIFIDDKNKCTFKTTTTINEPEPFNIKTDIKNSCTEDGNGAIELIVSGATPPFSYLWDNDLTTPSIYNLLPNIYTLLLEDYNKCTLNLQFVIDEDVCPPYVEIFNIFTPNNDGKNDLLFIKTEYVETYNASIYNRWGEKIYEWNQNIEGWNGKEQKTGKDCVEGTYFCMVEAVGTNGETIKVTGSVGLYKK